VIVATGVIPRDPGIPGQDGPNVLSYVDVLAGKAPVGRRVAVVGAGGIGFDVAEFLVHEGDSPTEGCPSLWRREWGVADPALHRGGLAPEGPRPEAPARRSCCSSARRKSPASGWARPPAGSTAPASR
jgi:2,4-dienoyl-CoA reductase (NADPH2)